MGNAEPVLKNFENFSNFFDENWPEIIFGENNTTRCLFERFSIDYCTKYSLFEAYSKNRTQKYTVCLPKNRNLNFLSPITHRKKFSTAESLKYDRW